MQTENKNIVLNPKEYNKPAFSVYPFQNGIIIHGKRRREIPCNSSGEAYRLWLRIDKRKVVTLIQDGKETGRG